MKLSIIVPVFNEESTIKKLLETINRINYGVPSEIIVVNDGSTDNTYEKIAESRKKFRKIRVISYTNNQGKGFAIRKGINAATGDILIIQDADLEYNPHQIPGIIEPIINKNVSVVYGSRFMGKIGEINPVFFIGNKILTLATNLFFFSCLTDMETCYKAISRDVLKNMVLKSNRFEVEAEITGKILKNGYKILELPISYTARSKKGGKKIGVRDGIKTLITIMKVRFGVI